MDLPSFILSGVNGFHKSSNDSDGSARALQEISSRNLPTPAQFLKPLSALSKELKSLRISRDASKTGLENARAISRLRLSQATTFEEWQAAAAELDHLEGNDSWKEEEVSDEYDHGLVRARLKKMDLARSSTEPEQILFQIRTALTRNLGRMGNSRLYTHTYNGTKSLIEDYIETVISTIDSLLATSKYNPSSQAEPRHLLDQLLLTRQSFGRSALLLSGGGTFGMNHIGVVKALFEARLLPRIISGASAGSIVCSVLCCKTDEELPNMLEDFCYGDLAVFTTGSEEMPHNMLARLLKHGSLFDISNLIRVMKNIIGDMTFQEAYNRTRRILNICVSSAGLYELPRLLNYISAPNVIIWSAVATSCSVPLVFDPSPLLAKDFKTGKAFPWNPSAQSWIDGSVDNDLPMTRLAEMFNVNHFIVSQVNPHVVPFLVDEGSKADSDSLSFEEQAVARPATRESWFDKAVLLAKDEALHRLHMLSESGVMPNLTTKLRSILSQKYSGDITIFPKISYAEFSKILRNPTPEFMIQAMLSGERATWPKLSQIRNHCAIELALDDAVQHMRTRVVFNDSQVNLHSLTAEKRLSRAASDGGLRRRNRSKRSRQRAIRQSDTQPSLHDLAHAPPAKQDVGLGTHLPPSKRLPASFILTPKASASNIGAEAPTSTASNPSEQGNANRLDPNTRSREKYLRLENLPPFETLFPYTSLPSTPSAAHYDGLISYSRNGEAAHGSSISARSSRSNSRVSSTAGRLSRSESLSQPTSKLDSTLQLSPTDTTRSRANSARGKTKRGILKSS